METPTKPAIFAEIRSKQEQAPTVLFYGHYDVQPPEPMEAWKTPPFVPTEIEGVLYGRGVADNKGQFMAHVMAVRSFLEVFGDVPVNVKFILDGEEESGSPSLPWLVEQKRELLKADLVYVSNHAPNVNLKLACYYRGIHATAQVLFELGAGNGAEK